MKFAITVTMDVDDTANADVKIEATRALANQFSDLVNSGIFDLGDSVTLLAVPKLDMQNPLDAAMDMLLKHAVECAKKG